MSDSIDLRVWLAAWLATAGGVWTLFARADSALRRGKKLEIARALRQTITVGRRLPRREIVQNWPEVFGGVFDAVFGERHFTWTCFYRSSLVSLATAVIVGLIRAAVYGSSVLELFRSFYRSIGADSILGNLLIGAIVGGFYAALFAAMFAASFVCINVIPDYLSLLETRQVIRWMSRTKRPLSLAALLALDIVATAAITLGGFLFFSELFFALSARYLRVSSGWELFVELLQTQVFPFKIMSVFFYSAFVTSVWIWLYAASIGLFVLVPRWLILIDRLMDIDRKPLEALGMVAAIVISVVFFVAFVAKIV